MSPPWVMFDSIASQGGDCANGADPDIAGIGVVLSFVIASVMTTSACILAMLLDHFFDHRGHFTLRTPIKYIREHFLDTEWKKNYAWRPFLDPLIIGFGDQQIVTGYAVLICAWIKVAQNDFEIWGAHFVLILYICALSSSSHLAALITLRKYLTKYRLIARIRVTFVSLFALLLLASMIAFLSVQPKQIKQNIDTTLHQSGMQSFSVLVPLFLILVGFTTGLFCIFYDTTMTNKFSSVQVLFDGSTEKPHRRLTDPKQILHPLKLSARLGLFVMYCLFVHPLIAFGVQISLAMTSAILVLCQKFTAPDDPTHFCGLQSKGENVWGFGQALSLIMLSLPVLSAGQIYLEGRQDIKRGLKRQKS